MSDRVYSVAIDGPAGAGKSTIARRAADALGFCYVDTGAIYRTVAYAALKQGLQPENAVEIAAFLPQISVELNWDELGVQHMYLSGEDVSHLIRTPEISQATSKISAIGEVRQFLLDAQRKAAKSNSVIMDGRDIGTVVLPDADVKIYLFASAEVRAKRRWLELQASGCDDTYEEVLEDVNRRDHRDMNREIAPLCRAEDAIGMDTSELTLEESIKAVLGVIREKIGL